MHPTRLITKICWKSRKVGKSSDLLARRRIHLEWSRRLLLPPSSLNTGRKTAFLFYEARFCEDPRSLIFLLSPSFPTGSSTFGSVFLSSRSVCPNWESLLLSTPLKDPWRWQRRGNPSIQWAFSTPEISSNSWPGEEAWTSLSSIWCLFSSTYMPMLNICGYAGHLDRFPLLDVLFPTTEGFFRHIWFGRQISLMHCVSDLGDRFLWCIVYDINSASAFHSYSRGLNFPAAKRILEEGMACDVIRIRTMVEKKERFAKRRQRVLGNKGWRSDNAYRAIRTCYDDQNIRYSEEVAVDHPYYRDLSPFVIIHPLRLHFRRLNVCFIFFILRLDAEGYRVIDAMLRHGARRDGCSRRASSWPGRS